MHAPDYQRSNINHAGPLGDDDLAALFEGALWLAFPSNTEGFKIPLLEARQLLPRHLVSMRQV